MLRMRKRLRELQFQPQDATPLKYNGSGGAKMGSFLQRLRYYLLILFDPQTPWYVKLILSIGLLYILVPVDFIADTIPVFGWLDDLAIASFIVALALRLVPQEVMTRVKRKVFGAR
jgi:uncharacterized membrane protein YkvA (DUF1232 family)